tara:strand:+ start:2639 stop:3676 length:1038 start_codon:yes stop_codon:yes gene_type:complete
MKIAVIGAGLFGCVTALELSKKFKVDLFEKQTDIMQCASGINQWRLHGGYHYPRSPDTMSEIQSSLLRFKEYFSNNIFVETNNYYAIAKHNSKTSAEQFENFCKTFYLGLTSKKLDFLNYDNIDTSYQVQEQIINPFKLKGKIKGMLIKSSVNLYTESNIDYITLKLNYDLVVLCTYGHDHLFTDKSIASVYKYQIVEKLLLANNEIDQTTSLVVIDGPFFSIDPYADTGQFLMSHVKHAIHSENIGTTPFVPLHLQQHLHTGLRQDIVFPNCSKMMQDAAKFFPVISKSTWKGSFFVTRCVKSNVEETDERTSSLNFISDKLVTIHSGKLVSCVNIAEELVSKL